MRQSIPRMNPTKTRKKYWCDFCGRQRVFCVFVPVYGNKPFVFIYKCINCGELMVKKAYDVREGFEKANDYLRREIGPEYKIEDFVRT